MPEQPTENQPQKPESELAGTTDQKSSPSQQLTPEEQMALYEEELKETDWGHQPC